jgi:hypothetical protein
MTNTATRLITLIFLGNPLKTDQAKLKTVLRHPVERI